MLCVAASSACAASSSKPAGAVTSSATLSSVRDRFTDEQGERGSFERWRGSTVVVATIYTSCTRICPLTVEQMRKVDAAYRRAGKRAEFVLVTLDPDSDTPERLRDFKSTRALPAEWHLLRGSERATRDVTDLLGVHTIDMGSHVVHNATIAVFDPRGALVRAFDDLDFDPSAAVVP